MRRGPVWIVAVAIVGVPSTAGVIQAQSTAEGVVRPDWTDAEVRPASSGIQVDARLDEPAWVDADVVELPWETGPLLNTRAPHRTECRITFDESNLYFGCHAFDDDPGSIRAFLTDRDETGGQDEIGLVIDPFRDSRRGFGFNLTPLGVQKDWVYDGETGNDAWDAIWDARGRVTDDGWVVEASIPFKSFRFPATPDVQSWGFFIWRNRPRSEVVAMRSVPWDPGNQCALCQMAVLRGIQTTSSGLNVELSPFATAARTDRRGDPAATRLDRGEIRDEYGANARWSITSDLTLNLTVNPDFSQVEADAAQLQSNQQFALFFPERRPFFLEGAELFETPMRAVFTRTIADPSVGAKVTGKEGGWAYGVLAARDERTNLLLPGPQSSSSAGFERENTAVIARARRDVGEASTVGALLTARGGGGYSNLVTSGDFRLRLAPSATVTGQVLRSETEYPTEVAADFGQPEGSFGGWAAKSQFDYRKREGWLTTFVTHIDPGFRADGGFMTQVDYQQFDLRGGLDFWKDEDPFFTRLRIGGGGGRFQESDGRLIGQFVFSDFGAFGPLQSELTVNPDLFWREFRGERFRVERVNIFGEAQPHRRIYTDLFLQFGRELDFVNARESGLSRISGSLDLRLGRAIEWDMDYDYKRLTYLDQPVFRESIAQTRIFYHFSNRFFLRGILQFRDVDRDPALYTVVVDPETRSLDTQFLLSYRLNPQSVVLLGYSDASFGSRENEDPLTRPDLTRMSRSFFLKVSYGWRP